MKTRTIVSVAVLSAAGGWGSIGSSRSSAAPINLTSATPTYTYNPRGAGAADPNAVASATIQLNNESGSTANSKYTVNAQGQTGTVIYTFNVTPNFSTINVTSRAGVFDTSGTSSIVGQYSTNGGTTYSGAFFTGSGGAAPETDALALGGATSILVRYTIVNGATSQFGIDSTQLFRSGGTATGTNGDYTFTVTAVPEPAALASLASFSAGLLVRRRRR